MAIFVSISKLCGPTWIEPWSRGLNVQTQLILTANPQAQYTYYPPDIDEETGNQKLETLLRTSEPEFMLIGPEPSCLSRE